MHGPRLRRLSRESGEGRADHGRGAGRGPRDVEVFHAGTARRNGDLVTAGGRVLNVCATGPTLRAALRTAYAAAAEIEWPSKILRHDIGRRVLESAPAEDAE